eukprot:CAMPEP_0172453320 /NCGR_PEP_ID=MMETSP1065-20121228/10699_1 /TAXON_ID=265537 /ORGANISM="Amphiprora paludosa, Strain CCMP125" /LENGTH=234 /DNA_ID=CAMNT_0013205499 /DNA_START=117 /DNA_END=821 /DNA_ORIENTATION=+
MGIVKIEWDGSSASSLLEAIQKQQPELPISSIEQLSVVVSEDAKGLYNTMDLAAVAPFLTANATVSVELSLNTENVQTVSTSFVLAGLQTQSEKRQGDKNRVILTAQRRPSPPTATTTASAPIRLSLDLDANDDDMIDEDALLLSDASNLVKPPPAMSDAAKVDDCSGREPCADCTCGRASENEQPQQPSKAASSSCGKCSLGDAWRCRSCPHLGKPAFKPGEEHLVLDLQDDL